MDPLVEADARDLVERVRDGDNDAWVTLTDRYVSLLWSVARSMRLSEADAADAVQTTWLRLVEALDGLRDPARVGIEEEILRQVEGQVVDVLVGEGVVRLALRGTVEERQVRRRSRAELGVGDEPVGVGVDDGEAADLGAGVDGEIGGA